MVGTLWLWVAAGTTDFVPQGILAEVAAEHPLEISSSSCC
jgi:hypothetical protein